MSLRPYQVSNTYEGGGGFGESRRNATADRPASSKFLSFKRVLMWIPLFALLSVLLPNEYLSEGSHGLRRLAEKCIHNIYASSPAIALNMPPAPPGVNKEQKPSVPSYITLCQELVKRELNPKLASEFILTENFDICMDWTSPHLGL